MVKMKDIFNKQKNQKNNQEILYLKKRKLKKFGMDIDDVMDCDVNKKLKEFESGE